LKAMGIHRPRGWSAAGDQLILVPAELVQEALAALDEEPVATNLEMAIERLTSRLGPPAPLPATIDPLVVFGPGDVPAAERRLLRALVKDTDGALARHGQRPLWLAVRRRLAP